MKADEVYAILKKQIQSGGGTPGPAGVGIQKIEKTGTVGLVDTYTITYTNGQIFTYTVTNGSEGDKGETGPQGPEGPRGPAGESGISPRQEMQNTDTTITLEPNTLYIFPEMTSLTVTLAEPDNSNVANEYHFFFASGATATTLTLNDVLSDAYSIEANMKYEVSILENVAYIKGVSTSAET